METVTYKQLYSHQVQPPNCLIPLLATRSWSRQKLAFFRQHQRHWECLKSGSLAPNQFVVYIPRGRAATNHAVAQILDVCRQSSGGLGETGL